MYQENEVWKEQLQVMQEENMSGSSDAFNPCLMPNLMLLSKLKVPNFEKFSGSECSLAHLGVYLQKMAAHCGDDNLLIQHFQDSLTREALRWYRIKIHTWDDVACAFITQYNNDIASNKLTLLNMGKKASRYSHDQDENMSAQSYPQVEKGKAVCLFDDFFKDPCFDHPIEGISQNFADLRITGKEVKGAVKIKDVQYTMPEQSSLKGVEKKKQR
ncbi:uncharacterized protein LOC131145856 [Malania oleifera]|uniref:uncharacterized protein LOC131145856 n=1 Tax=Malania oleifera TaxID=397392 RepID=UPI0025AE0E5E|nr:uncharacterized protein LOC131145856 [Malania oleifera]